MTTIRLYPAAGLAAFMAGGLLGIPGLAIAGGLVLAPVIPGCLR